MLWLKLLSSLRKPTAQLPIGRAAWEIFWNNQEHFPDLGSDTSSDGMEFLRSFLRRHFAGNQ